jgi:integrase
LQATRAVWGRDDLPAGPDVVDQVSGGWGLALRIERKPGSSHRTRPARQTAGAARERRPGPAATRPGEEVGQFQAIRRRLPVDLQVAVTIAFTYGWRRNEVLTLTRPQLDLEAGTLRLEPGTTKNDDGREVDLTDELIVLLGAQVERVQALERELGRVIPYLFPHLRGAKALREGVKRRAPVLGEPMRDFRRAWATACRQAGLPGLLKHDLRRSAVRHMVNRGIPER